MYKRQVFNPLPFTRDEVVEVDLDLPEMDNFCFTIFDAYGNEIYYYKDNQAKAIHTVQQTYGFPLRFYAVRHKVYFWADSIPAFGHKTYIVRRAQGSTVNRVEQTTEDKVLITAKNQMENEYLRVEINDNGTLKILDKRTGKSYDRLNFFEDSGEVGDAYEHRQPKNDAVITSLNGKASIKLIEKNPFKVAFRIKVGLKLPERVTSDKTRRLNDRRRKCNIVSTVTLAKGARRIDIVTVVDNVVKDHRLRAMFPTGIKTNYSYAEGQFDVLKRPISKPPINKWIEPPCSTHPQLNFVDLSNGKVGLAVINEGLPEYEVVDSRERTIACLLYTSPSPRD